MKPRLITLMAAALISAALAVHAQQPAKKAAPPAKAAAPGKSAITEEFEKFREVLEEDNPAELFEAKGEDIWKNRKGPDGGSMAQCDLGLGAGVVKGAYVRMPRYFADVGGVMDAERRVVHCMVKYLGYQEADILRQPFSNDRVTPDHVSVITYVAGQSRNLKIAAPKKHPKEIAAYEIGREIFAYRAGPYDFSCATCHGDDGKRIRTQDLPNLRKPDQAIRAYQGWPGYRMTGGFMLTQQWRMNDCFRQQRFPEPTYLSDSVTALLAYMTVTANGQVYKGPGIKR
jgi:sulfur-oxidizing protein SoxA